MGITAFRPFAPQDASDCGSTGELAYDPLRGRGPVDHVVILTNLGTPSIGVAEPFQHGVEVQRAMPTSHAVGELYAVSKQIAVGKTPVKFRDLVFHL